MEPDQTFPVEAVESDELSGGVQAVDTAVRVLSALAEMGPPLMLKTVAERAGMPPPKAHRYLVSFCRGGLAERDPASGGYRLGPLAVRLGLAALRHLDVVAIGSATLAALRDEVGFTSALAVWGSAGPTYVRFEETNDAVIITGRPGSVMPILTSATGRVFGAYLPRFLTGALLDRELAGHSIAGVRPPHPIGRDEAGKRFSDVRKHRMARVQGEVNPGLHGLAAPVFDHTGALVAVVAIMGSPGVIDTKLDGDPAGILAKRADEISRRMGWAPP